jgi:hypothetical protein
MKKAAHPMDRTSHLVQSWGQVHSGRVCGLRPLVFSYVNPLGIFTPLKNNYWTSQLAGVHVQICNVLLQHSQGSWFPHPLWKPWTRFIMFGGILMEHKNLWGHFRKWNTCTCKHSILWNASYSNQKSIFFSQNSNVDRYEWV